jgi:hypothetical protein
MGAFYMDYLNEDKVYCTVVEISVHTPRNIHNPTNSTEFNPVDQIVFIRHP